MIFTRERVRERAINHNGCFANEKQRILAILQQWKVFCNFFQNVQMNRSSVMFVGYNSKNKSLKRRTF